MRVLAPVDGGVRELASGVDALYLSGHGYLSKGFLAQLEEELLSASSPTGCRCASPSTSAR